MGVPNGTYARGSVSGNMLTIRPTMASTSQTNPRENGNGVKKIDEATGICRVCSHPVTVRQDGITYQRDAIMICECDYCLVHLECEATWSQRSEKKCRSCKKELLIRVTVDRVEITEERQNRSLVSALKR
ncbi:hypothetical protein LOK49_LG07G00752 [Camellia lanceoleosa]|uniref:Uncharacterized protein n=1 Tax=Camellia lanceoleosa TaxID=1840588 RepID=A0ACC0H505_9ERIC|nr:hypothetical protein LOK49_LG07G00752 [Camellia lanceoleosa]